MGLSMKSPTILIALAIIAAGALVATAIALRPLPERYTFSVSNGEIRRYDTATGEALYCARAECGAITEQNGRLEITSAPVPPADGR